MSTRLRHGCCAGLTIAALGCGPPEDTSETPLPPADTPDTASTAVCPDGRVTYNASLHESLPAEWIDEYAGIMENLDEVLPVCQAYFTTVDVYAWNDSVEDPYAGIDGGAYVGRYRGELIMVLEIPAAEFKYDYMHRYSVIPHEYFHTYQLSISPSMSALGFDVKWLIEGSAATVESIYMQQHYGFNYFEDAQTYVDADAIGDPSMLERYDSYKFDINYSSSVFLTLVLARELQSLGYSEEESFYLIFQSFLEQEPTQESWMSVFESHFGMSVETFYASLSDYPLDTAAVLPSETLTMEAIFTR